MRFIDHRHGSRHHRHALLVLICFFSSTNSRPSSSREETNENKDEIRILKDLTQIISKIPIDYFAGDTKLIQSIDPLNENTHYKGIGLSDADPTIYQRIENDSGKKAVVLSSAEDKIAVFKEKKTYVGLRKVFEDSKDTLYYVFFIYLRDATHGDENVFRVGNSKKIIEYDSWDNRENEGHLDKLTSSLGWSHCSASIFVPCRLDENQKNYSPPRKDNRDRETLSRAKISAKTEEGEVEEKKFKLSDGSDPNVDIDFYWDLEDNLLKAKMVGPIIRSATGTTAIQQKFSGGGRGLLDGLLGGGGGAGLLGGLLGGGGGGGGGLLGLGGLLGGLLGGGKKPGAQSSDPAADKKILEIRRRIIEAMKKAAMLFKGNNATSSYNTSSAAPDSSGNTTDTTDASIAGRGISLNHNDGEQHNDPEGRAMIPKGIGELADSVIKGIQSVALKLSEKVGAKDIADKVVGDKGILKRLYEKAKNVVEKGSSILESGINIGAKIASKVVEKSSKIATVAADILPNLRSKSDDTSVAKKSDSVQGRGLFDLGIGPGRPAPMFGNKVVYREEGIFSAIPIVGPIFNMAFGGNGIVAGVLNTAGDIVGSVVKGASNIISGVVGSVFGIFGGFFTGGIGLSNVVNAYGGLGSSQALVPDVGDALGMNLSPDELDDEDEAEVKDGIKRRESGGLGGLISLDVDIEDVSKPPKDLPPDMVGGEDDEPADYDPHLGAEAAGRAIAANSEERVDEDEKALLTYKVAKDIAFKTGEKIGTELMKTDLYSHPGWKTIDEGGAPDATLNHEDDAFVGFGACKYQKVKPSEFAEAISADELLTLLSKALRTYCSKESTKLYKRLIDDKLILYTRYNTFQINPNNKYSGREKLTTKRKNDIVRAIELAAFSRAFKDEIEGEEPHSAPSKSPVSRRVYTFGQTILNALSDIRTFFRAHQIKLIRSLTITTKTAFLKLLQDYEITKDCESCVMDNEVQGHDQAYIMSIYNFLLHGLGPVEHRGIDIKIALRTFNETNFEAIESKIKAYL